MAPIFTGTRSCTGRAAVTTPRYAKKSPWKSIDPSSSNVRTTWCASRNRAIGRVPRHCTPYCSSIAMFPMPMTTSARPPLSSSNVAASCAM
jgi:hypothetical protein